MKEKHLILYDGYCLMCNWWVRFLIDRDKSNQFLFFPIQKLKGSELPEDVLSFSTETVAVYFKGFWYYKSAAVLVLLEQVRFPLSLLGLGKFLPLLVRDGLYNLIARNRFKIFKRYEACPIIPIELMDKFPDPGDFANYLK